jgi:hypothetical protein
VEKLLQAQEVEAGTQLSQQYSAAHGGGDLAAPAGAPEPRRVTAAEVAPLAPAPALCGEGPSAAGEGQAEGARMLPGGTQAAGAGARRGEIPEVRHRANEILIATRRSLRMLAAFSLSPRACILLRVSPAAHGSLLFCAHIPADLRLLTAACLSGSKLKKKKKCPAPAPQLDAHPGAAPLTAAETASLKASEHAAAAQAQRRTAQAKQRELRELRAQAAALEAQSAALLEEAAAARRRAEEGLLKKEAIEEDEERGYAAAERAEALRRAAVTRAKPAARAAEDAGARAAAAKQAAADAEFHGQASAEHEGSGLHGFQTAVSECLRKKAALVTRSAPCGSLPLKPPPNRLPSQPPPPQPQVLENRAKALVAESREMAELSLDKALDAERVAGGPASPFAFCRALPLPLRLPPLALPLAAAPALWSCLASPTFDCLHFNSCTSTPPPLPRSPAQHRAPGGRGAQVADRPPGGPRPAPVHPGVPPRDRGAVAPHRAAAGGGGVGGGRDRAGGGGGGGVAAHGGGQGGPGG